MTDENQTPHTDQLHGLIDAYDSFYILLDDLNTEQYSYEVLAAIEGIGKDIDQTTMEEYECLTHLEMGWLRMLWEAHQEDETEKATIGGVA